MQLSRGLAASNTVKSPSWRLISRRAQVAKSSAMEVEEVAEPNSILFVQGLPPALPKQGLQMLFQQ